MSVDFKRVLPFCLTLIVGIVCIIVFRLAFQSNPIRGSVFAVLCAVISMFFLFFYYQHLLRNSGTVNDAPSDVERAGDELYYVGFLYTLISLVLSLIFVYSASAFTGERGVAYESKAIHELVGSFGIALLTTILGVFFRIVFQTMLRDDLEEEPRRKHSTAGYRTFKTQQPDSVFGLDSATLQFRTELQSALRHIQHFNSQATTAFESLTLRVNRLIYESGGKIPTIAEKTITATVQRIERATQGIIGRVADNIELASMRAINSIEQNTKRGINQIGDANEAAIEGFKSSSMGAMGSFATYVQEVRDDSIEHLKKNAEDAIGLITSANSQVVAVAQKRSDNFIKSVEQTFDGHRHEIDEVANEVKSSANSFITDVSSTVSDTAQAMTEALSVIKNSTAQLQDRLSGQLEDMRLDDQTREKMKANMLKAALGLGDLTGSIAATQQSISKLGGEFDSISMRLTAVSESAERWETVMHDANVRIGEPPEVSGRDTPSVSRIRRLVHFIGRKRS